MMHTESSRVEGSGQFVDYIEHVTYYVKRVVHKLRVTVHCGGYASQSWGKVERWDGKLWREVATISGPALSVDSKIGYSSRVDAASFRTDRNRLVELAEEVL